MRNLMFLLVLLLGAQSSAAKPFGFGQDQDQGHDQGQGLMLAENLLPQQRPQERQLPPLAQRLDPRAAAAQVKRHYQAHKILAISLIDSQGPTVYRVKTLSPDGVVKYVYVDGSSGDVFE
ncbi:MAG: hypothetical protein NWS96_07980 [Pseudomonadales bacterium]|jgi:uncharacterized membrane protein YkoI|nr:hypothetical protein [Pseudomonadales bacterium]MDP4640363.1 hypothetical protein [Pseudomonadales bacterium]